MGTIMVRRSSTTLVGLAALALALIAYWASGSTGDGRQPAAPASGPVATAEAVPELERVEVSESPSDVTPPQATMVKVRDAIRDYWGPRAPPIEAAMLAEGLDVDGSFELRPWEDVAESFQEMFDLEASGYDDTVRASVLRWPDELTSEWLLERYNLSEVDPQVLERHLPDIEQLVRPFNDEIRSKTEPYVLELSLAAKTAWVTGDYQKAPFATAGLPGKRGKALHSGARAHGGWAVKYHLYSEEHPHIVELQLELSRIRKERQRVLTKFLASLRGR